MTREDIIEFVDKQAPMGLKPMGWKLTRGHFIKHVLYAFDSVDEMYNADSYAFAKTQGRNCGKKTLALWSKVNEFIYNSRKEANKLAHDQAEAAAYAAKLRELEDPWISKEDLKKITDLVAVLELPGIRFRKFQEFLESVKAPSGSPIETNENTSKENQNER